MSSIFNFLRKYGKWIIFPIWALVLVFGFLFAMALKAGSIIILIITVLIDIVFGFLFVANLVFGYGGFDLANIMLLLIIFAIVNMPLVLTFLGSELIYTFAANIGNSLYGFDLPIPLFSTKDDQDDTTYVKRNSKKRVVYVEEEDDEDDDFEAYKEYRKRQKAKQNYQRQESYNYKNDYQESNNSNNYREDNKQNNYNKKSSKSDYEKNYYSILGVSKNATQDEIKSAYRREMAKYHPDRNSNSENSTEITKLINEAYQVLSDPVKREQYDRFGRTL